MNFEDKKNVIIIDSSLDRGVVANVASILSISLGSQIEGLVGPAVHDHDGAIHQGLTRLPVPILGATTEEIKNIRKRFVELETEEKFLFDFSTFAQEARSYDEYIQLISKAAGNEIVYLGIALIAGKKAINKSTKGLTLIQ